MAVAAVNQLERLLGADVLGLWAAGAKPAAAGPVEWAGDVPTQHDVLALALQGRVGDWHRRDQRLGERRAANARAAAQRLRAPRPANTRSAS